MSLNKSQQIALAMGPKVSSALSMAGSSWILGKIVWQYYEDRSSLASFKQIMLAMSAYDILVSFWMFLSTWPIPVDTVDRFANVGTTASCSAQGFFVQLGTAVPIYNVCLSVYYFLVIRHAWTEDYIHRRILPRMHALGFLFPVGTAVAALVLDQYNDSVLWCWISDLPSGCADNVNVPCERGGYSDYLRWAFYYGPLWMFIFVAIVAMMLIFCSVREIEQKSLKYRRPQVMFERGSTLGNAISGVESSQQDGQSPSPGSTGPASPSASQALTDFIVRRTKFWEDYERTREVFGQALCYLGAFLLTFVFATINRAYQSIAGESKFSLNLLQAMTLPLQGFLNFLVYRRPRYLRERKRHPEHGRLGAVATALRFSSGHISGSMGPHHHKQNTTTSTTAVSGSVVENGLVEEN